MEVGRRREVRGGGRRRGGGKSEGGEGKEELGEEERGPGSRGKVEEREGWEKKEKSKVRWEIRTRVEEECQRGQGGPGVNNFGRGQQLVILLTERSDIFEMSRAT
jgi:hypothetical protein